MTFTPPKPWAPDRFRSVVTSLEDKTIIDPEAIPWCTTHDHQSNESLHACLAGIIKEGACHISTGGPDHKWWKDTV